MIAFQALIENRDKSKSMRKSVMYWEKRKLAQTLDGWKRFVHKRKENILKVTHGSFHIHTMYLVAHAIPRLCTSSILMCIWIQCNYIKDIRQHISQDNGYNLIAG